MITTQQVKDPIGRNRDWLLWNFWEWNLALNMRTFPSEDGDQKFQSLNFNPRPFVSPKSISLSVMAPNLNFNFYLAHSYSQQPVLQINLFILLSPPLAKLPKFRARKHDTYFLPWYKPNGLKALTAGTDGFVSGFSHYGAIMENLHAFPLSHHEILGYLWLWPATFTCTRT